MFGRVRDSTVKLMSRCRSFAIIPDRNVCIRAHPRPGRTKGSGFGLQVRYRIQPCSRRLPFTDGRLHFCELRMIASNLLLVRAQHDECSRGDKPSCELRRSELKLAWHMTGSYGKPIAVISWSELGSFQYKAI